MAQVLTKIQAYGVEAQEPVFKRHIQYAILTMTGLNTDVTYDFGTYAGTFWTAVGATDPGTTALKFFKDVALRAQANPESQSGELQSRSLSSGESTRVLTGTIAGGAASTAAVVTGLLTTDTILSVSGKAKNANSLPLLGWSTQIADGLTALYSADPGANGTILVAYNRGSATPDAGQYSISYSNKAPIITFKSGDAPTSWDLVLKWVLNAGDEPIGFVADSSGSKAS